MKAVLDAFYWVCLSIVIILLVAIPVRAVWYSDTNYSQVIQYVALITLSVSVILMIGDVVKLIQLPDSVRNIIVTCFLTSVLSAAAALIVRVWQSSNNMTARIVLLDESKVKHITADGKDVFCASDWVHRQSSDYKLAEPGEFGIFIAVVAKNVQADAKRRPNLTGFIFVNSGMRMSNFEPISRSQGNITDFDGWKASSPDCEVPKNESRILAETGADSSDLIILRYLTDFSPELLRELAQTRRGQVSVVLTDHIAGLSAVQLPPVEVNLR